MTTTIGAAVTYTQYEYDELNRLETLTHIKEDDPTPGLSAGDLVRAEFAYELQIDGRRGGVVEKFFDNAGGLTQTNHVVWTCHRMSPEPEKPQLANPKSYAF